MITATLAVFAVLAALSAAWIVVHFQPTLSLRDRLAYAAAAFRSDMGAISLAEAAKLSQDDLQRGVIETFIQTSPILAMLDYIEIEGNAYAYNEEATLPGVEFRAVNTGYTESTGTVNPKTESLVILGGDADTDTFIQKTRSNFNDQRAVQTALKVKAGSYLFQDTFVNGDTGVDVNSFDGLKTRLTGGQVLAAAANGLPVIGADDAARHAFLDKLDEAISLVDGDVAGLLMNKSIRQKLKASARRLGFWDNQRDEFGRLVDFYDGIPLLDAGDTAAGSAVIPQTETQGTSNVASSIYVIAKTEDESSPGVAGLTNGGVSVRDLGEVDDKPAYRTRVEFFTGIAVFGKGASRLTGVLNA